MNILKNRTVLGLICIVLSLIICFGLTPLFNSAVQAQVEVVRLTRDVQQGERITADMVTAVNVGGFNLPNNVIQNMDNVIGRYARHDMLRESHILVGNLSDTPLAEFPYLNNLDGTRVAISMSIPSFAAGLSAKLEAGDIITVFASDFGDFRLTIAPPELRYVEVLAVTDARGNDKEPFAHRNPDEDRELPATLTLLVYPQQALLLTELENTARIHTALVFRGAVETRSMFLQVQSDFIFPQEDEYSEYEILQGYGLPDIETPEAYAQEVSADE
ncbi:MAG: RcpC/CpaB family pilus assembly protein [Defluviitaleaceae bacterium]|nr:RcpC/CpaB family pilus assembly protein [Defluviitaleaceae bacterium]MCL2275167.1 RcpC/CpaB family pilus assembly protein [Defluviitaleaceae bacterium]